jgi:dTDP-4-dehydrorhamnose reductase
MPIVKKAKEFVRYYWLDTGEGESLSVFKDKAGADESVRLAADYIKEHLSKLLTQKPEIIEGANQGSRLSTDKLSNAVGVWAGSQPWIPMGEQYESLMRTAMMQSVSLCVRMKN